MNRTILVGRLTADPELRTTPNGIATSRITVAVNRMPNANGERVADFINVVVWRRQAENVAKYCSKGSLVGVEGRIQTRNYDAQDGTRRYVTEIVADNVTFLGSRNATGGAMEINTSSGDAPSFGSVPIVDDGVEFPTGTSDYSPNVSDDPFKDFGSEVILSDDDLPF